MPAHGEQGNRGVGYGHGVGQDGYPLIVTAGVVRRGDTVLIARRASGPLAGQWEFPGGKLEPGESPETCLARELREELGLEVQVEEVLAVVYHEYPERPVLLLAYLCRLPDSPPTGTWPMGGPRGDRRAEGSQPEGTPPHGGRAEGSQPKDRPPDGGRARGSRPEGRPREGRRPEDRRGDGGAWGPAGTWARWVEITDLGRYAFAPADLPIVEKLQRTGRNIPASLLPDAAGGEGSGYRWPDVPAAVRSQVVRFVDAISGILTGNLLGIYLHGSLALGGFNPERSDIDLLVLMREGMAVETKRRIVESLLGLSGCPRPIEVSFLREADLIPWKHPTPYDLHFSEAWRSRYTDELESGTWMHWNDTTCNDPDLAAHITVTRHRGVCLAGKPARESLPPVPWHDYLESIVGDLTWAAGRAEGDPTYLLLNACRVLAAAREGLILSKPEAAVWALEELPEALRPAVRRALRQYRGDPSDPTGPAAAQPEGTAGHE